ncbi:unnamed protein product, partial [Rotaria sp. Silwood2]
DLFTCMETWIRLENNNGNFSMSRVYQVNEFIEQETAAVFHFDGLPIFSE